MAYRDSSFSRDHSTPYAPGTSPGNNGKVRSWEPIATDQFTVRFLEDSLVDGLVVTAKDREDAIWKFMEHNGIRNGIRYVKVNGERNPTTVDIDAKTITRSWR